MQVQILIEEEQRRDLKVAKEKERESVHDLIESDDAR